MVVSSLVPGDKEGADGDAREVGDGEDTGSGTRGGAHDDCSFDEDDEGFGSGRLQSPGRRSL